MVVVECGLVSPISRADDPDRKFFPEAWLAAICIHVCLKIALN